MRYRAFIYIEFCPIDFEHHLHVAKMQAEIDNAPFSEIKILVKLLARGLVEMTGGGIIKDYEMAQISFNAGGHPIHYLKGYFYFDKYPEGEQLANMLKAGLEIEDLQPA